MIRYPDALKLAWPVLMEAVRQRRTISYSELAGRSGRPLTARAIHRQLLYPLAARCRALGLPDLCALVVQKGTGRPGSGWFEPALPGDPMARWAAAVEECHARLWPARPPAELLRPPEESSERPAKSRKGGGTR